MQQAGAGARAQHLAHDDVRESPSTVGHAAKCGGCTLACAAPALHRCLQVKRLAVAAATLVVFAGVCTFLIFELELPRLWSFLAVGLVAGGWVAKAVAWPLVDVPRRGYAVRDKDILYKSGVLWRSAQAVPFNRIQHAVRGSGPVERGFGLASLTAYTAGGSGGDLRIAGLGRGCCGTLAHLHPRQAGRCGLARTTTATTTVPSCPGRKRTAEQRG